MWIWDVPHRLQCWCNTWLPGGGAICWGWRTFKTRGLASRIGLLLVEPGAIPSLVWPESSASYLMLKWRSPCCSHLLLWKFPCCPCHGSSKTVSQDKPVFSQVLLPGIMSQQWESELYRGEWVPVFMDLVSWVSMGPQSIMSSTHLDLTRPGRGKSHLGYSVPSPAGNKACLYRKVGEESWDMDPGKQEGDELAMQREKLGVMWPLWQRNGGASEDTKD